MQVLCGKLNKSDHIEYLDLHYCGEEELCPCCSCLWSNSS